MDKDSEQNIIDEINKASTDSLKKKLAQLSNLNNERTIIEETGYEKEYYDLKSAYEAKYVNFYQEIATIVKGDNLPNLTPEDMTKYNVQTGTESTEKEIPEFWSKALKNSKYFPMNDKDEEILKHLVDVRLVLSDKINFTVEFEFSANAFLTNTVLSKQYIHDEKTFEIEKTVGCNITWTSPDKNPRKKIVTKKVKKGKSVETKTQEKDVPSFFDLFQDETKDLLNPDEAEFLKDDFIPFGFEYYLNLLESEDYDDEGEEDEDDEDEDDDDEDDKKKKPKGPKGDGKKEEKCKNQ